jgi:hypothetical protein
MVQESDRYVFGLECEYEITVACGIEDRCRAWRLVYGVYLEKGYAKPCAEELWYGDHDALPDTTTFLVTRSGDDIAALTTVFDGVAGLPAEGLYGNELDNLRGRGRRLCEIVSLVNTEKVSARSFEILLHLFRAAFVTARHLERATDFMITVNPHHVPYYERVLLFERVGEEKTYSKVSGAPAVLMRLDLERASERYRERYASRSGRRNLHRFFADGIPLLCRWLSRRRVPLDWGSLHEYFGIPLLVRSEAVSAA